jgi:hypothetical protein
MLREHVRARVDDVQRRIAHVRSYIADPWIQFGAAVAVGYLLGCDDHAETAAGKHHAPETIVHAVVRTALVTLVSSGIRRAMSAPDPN